MRPQRDDAPAAANGRGAKGSEQASRHCADSLPSVLDAGCRCRGMTRCATCLGWGALLEEVADRRAERIARLREGAHDRGWALRQGAVGFRLWTVDRRGRVWARGIELDGVDDRLGMRR